MATDLSRWEAIGREVDEKLNELADEFGVANCVLLLDIRVGRADPKSPERSLRAVLDDGVGLSDRLPVKAVSPCVRPSLRSFGAFFKDHLENSGPTSESDMIEARVEMAIKPLIQAFEELEGTAGWYEFETREMGALAYQWGFDLHVYGVLVDKEAAIVHIGVLD